MSFIMCSKSMEKGCWQPLRKVIFLVVLAAVFFCGAVVQASVSGKEMASEIALNELEFKDAKVQDAIRIISELTGVNIIATASAGKAEVTLFVRDMKVSQIIDSMCRIARLWYRYNAETGVYVIMSTEEYEDDIVIFRHEPTRKFQLKYLNVGIAARTIADLYGTRVKLEGKANEQFGSDYKVKDSYDKFTEDYVKVRDDEGDDETSSEDDKEKDLAEQDLELSSAQLRLLEKNMRAGVLRVSEKQVGEVDQRSEATIYVSINRLHNMLFVRTSDEKAMEEIAKLIEDSDQQVPEVLLEMKVLEVQLTDQFQSAFDISNISGHSQTGPADGQAINPLSTSDTSVGSTLMGSGNFGIMENSTMVFQALSGNIRLRMQLLEENGNIHSLATPMLLAANNHPAKLFIGEQTILTTGFKTEKIRNYAGSGTTVYNYVPVPVTEKREVGNTLTILPSINADRSVVLRIMHENSSVELNGGRIPLLVGSSVEYVNVDTVNTSTLTGTALAQDGMTIAVGGMMRTSYNDVESKVPVLGDIPLLGFFFTEKSKKETKTELVLLITPHVLSTPSQGETVTRHRVGELLEHPNTLDEYLVKLEDSRSELEQHVADKAMEQNPPLAASVLDSGVLEKSFVELTKMAVKQVRKPYLFRQPEGRMLPVQLRDLGQIGLFDNPDLICTGAGAWTNGYHFVTAIRVENDSNSDQEIDLGLLNGEWQAATVEQDILLPEGEEGDFTYLYLISEERFEKKLEVQ